MVSLTPIPMVCMFKAVVVTLVAVLAVVVEAGVILSDDHCGATERDDGVLMGEAVKAETTAAVAKRLLPTKKRLLLNFMVTKNNKILGVLAVS